MTRLAAIAALGLLAGCQDQSVLVYVSQTERLEPPRDTPAISVMQSQERGGNSPSTLNPPITATVPNAKVQVNAAGDQSGSTTTGTTK